MQLIASKSQPPVGALITIEAVKESLPIDIKWDNVTSIEIGEGVTLTNNASIARFVKFETLFIFNKYLIARRSRKLLEVIWSFSSCRFLARSVEPKGLYGNNPHVRTEIDHWLTYTMGPLSCPSEFTNAIEYIDTFIGKDRKFLVGSMVSVADYVVVGALFVNGYWKSLVDSKKAPQNLLFWFNQMISHSEVKKCLAAIPPEGIPKASAIPPPQKNKKDAGVKSSGSTKPDASKPGKEEGKFVDLPGAEMGKVIVRFPPEASGYLHVGHAKAALLNQHYQQHFKGKLIMRFDDTNPAKEKEEYENVILEDLKQLKVKYDHFSRTSDHFETILGYCEKLLKEGKAYVDNTDAETMKAEREARQESKNRNNSVENNWSMWLEMKKGSELGQKCAVRPKMNMQSDNGCMRDPTIYRCKNETHPATGNRFKVYPTYDFACPIVDSIEGVTHSLRTTEYMDRDEQFNWFIDALGLRKPNIYAYARLNLTNTVMSKRKLTWFVDEGLVEGWDDPRFPTVRGIIRRGLTVDALKQFIVAQGSSRSVVFMEWDKIWAINKKMIDPVAPRYTAIEKVSPIPVYITGDVKTESTQIDKHPKDASVGQKTIWRSPVVMIDEADADCLKEGENTTFINWGNLTIQKVNRENGKIISVNASTNFANTDFKKTLKLTWLAKVEDEPKANFTPTCCVYYDHIISKAVLQPNDEFKDFIGKDTKIEIDMLGDPELKLLKKGDIIQLQRRGFFIVDVAYKAPSVHTCRPCSVRLIAIPDGTPDSYGPPSKKGAKLSGAKSSGAAQSLEARKLEKKGKATACSTKKTSTPPPGTDLDELNEQIVKQGNEIRQLKANKAGKPDVDIAVKSLLDLKAQYKCKTGKDWKPGEHEKSCKEDSAAISNKQPSKLQQGNDADLLNEEIVKQGNEVRHLKSNKAEKSNVDTAVKSLLELKAKYKEKTGKDWKPGEHEKLAKNNPKDSADNKPSAPMHTNMADKLNEDIIKQGNKVRELKSNKAGKSDVDNAVKVLLDLKTKYKESTGNDWKPGMHVNTTISNVENNTIEQLNSDITKQGDKVRILKSSKSAKADIDEAVAVLLDLKEKYKQASGCSWKPEKKNDGDAKEASKKEGKNAKSPSSKESSPVSEEKAISGLGAQLNEDIISQGTKVRQLKTDKADEIAIKTAVDTLLGLKAKFKKVTGSDWKPAGSSGNAGKQKQQQQKVAGGQKDKGKGKKQGNEKSTGGDGGAPGGAPQKQTRLGMEAKKADNLADWYSQVIVKAEMLEYYDVSGCYILRPWAYSIWELVQSFFDSEIKKLGVENCYFPIFVSHAALEKEKDHIADFAPEVAWVTKSGDSDLAEPIAIRPTSETVMYPAYAKWIQSHRDLPLKLNQWNNVVRWEFKHPQPFLRTREFLWQEGHTAFATLEEAKEEVLTILDLYRQIYEDILAVPVVCGQKTEKEKFAGGDYTYTTEAYIAAAGRAIQGATSHHLGQNFSKMFNIVVEDPETGEKKNIYQNSWGFTTRSLGVLVMVHGDDKGLVLPPKAASIQVVIVPCGITASLGEDDRKALYDACKEYENNFRVNGIKVRGDYRENYSPGWKFNHWELKGVPIRLELGPRDVKANQFVTVRRDTGEKITMKKENSVNDVKALLTNIQDSLFKRAKHELDSHLSVVESWDGFVAALDNSNIIQAPFCGIEECEDQIKDLSKADVEVEPGAPSMGAKSLCIPSKQPKQLAKDQKCVKPGCNNMAKNYTLFGRSY